MLFYYFKQGILVLGLGIYKMRGDVFFLTVLEFGEDVDSLQFFQFMHILYSLDSERLMCESWFYYLQDNVTLPNLSERVLCFAIWQSGSTSQGCFEDNACKVSTDKSVKYPVLNQR